MVFAIKRFGWNEKETFVISPINLGEDDNLPGVILLIRVNYCSLSPRRGSILVLNVRTTVMLYRDNHTFTKLVHSVLFHTTKYISQNL